MQARPKGASDFAVIYAGVKTAYTHKDLVQGQEYEAMVRASNVCGDSAWSQVLVKSTKESRRGGSKADAKAETAPRKRRHKAKKTVWTPQLLMAIVNQNIAATGSCLLVCFCLVYPG